MAPTLCRTFLNRFAQDGEPVCLISFPLICIDIGLQFCQRACKRRRCLHTRFECNQSEYLELSLHDSYKLTDAVVSMHNDISRLNFSDVGYDGFFECRGNLHDLGAHFENIFKQSTAIFASESINPVSIFPIQSPISPVGIESKESTIVCCTP